MTNIEGFRWLLFFSQPRAFLMKGASGLRKVRWKQSARGKRGGLRLLYYWDPVGDRIFMIYAYEKTKQSDLSPAQVKQLGKIVREELK